VRAIPRALTAGLVLAALLLLSAAVGGAANPKGEAAEQMKVGLKAANRGYWLEALMRFEQADTLTPNEPHILNNIAVALEAAGRFEQALLAYQSALAVAPEDRVLQRNYKSFKDFYDENVAAPVADEETPGGQQVEDRKGSSEEEHESSPSH